VTASSHNRVSNSNRHDGGWTLLELLASMTLLSLAAVAITASSLKLSSAAGLSAARTVALRAATDARRLAYLESRWFDLEITPGMTELVVSDGLLRHDPYPLPGGVSVLSAPTRGYVRFQAGGFADNSTMVLAGRRGGTVKLVINQRGLVH
jgi:type II secretory pathway pseudopilin PulG